MWTPSRTLTRTIWRSPGRAAGPAFSLYTPGGGYKARYHRFYSINGFWGLIKQPTGGQMMYILDTVI